MKRSLPALLSLLAVLSATPSSHADAQSLSFGLMAGGSLSTFSGDLAVDVKNHATFIAGGFLHASMAGFSVEPGLFYTQKGAESGSDSPTSTVQKLNYIQVPLVLRLGLPLGKLKLYVGGGPAIGLNIGCTFTPQTGGVNGASTDCADAGEGSGIGDAESTEIAAIGVAGLDFGKFSLGLRYDGAVTNSFKAITSGAEKPDLKTKTISAVAAIRF